jgi:hypothetical protein
LKTLFSILNINISKINHGKLLPLWMASTLSSERKGSVLLQFFLIPGYPNGSAARIIFYIKIGSSKLCFGSAVSCTKDWYIFHSICMVKFSKKNFQWIHTACSTILSWCTHIYWNCIGIIINDYLAHLNIYWDK